MAGLTTQIGNRGEDLAVEWLRKSGYLIVARNWRCGRYELDIIAQKGFSLHIIEVKTRRLNGLTTPEDAMTPHKVKTLLKGANIYTSSHPTHLEVQIDLIAVDIDDYGAAEVRYIAKAVECRW